MENEADDTRVAPHRFQRMGERDDLTARAHQLLLTAFGAGVIQADSASSMDEFARDCVRHCRAIDAEVAQSTERPQPGATKLAQRPAPPGRDEDLTEDWTR